jgi:hypothetical protein
MNEARVPEAWYAVVSNGWLISYLDHYRAMQDPSLEPMPSEGPDCAKLSSSTFGAFTDYEEVLGEARKLAEIMTGAMKVQQGPGNLVLKNIVGVHSDGSIERFPPYGRAVSMRLSRRHTQRFIQEGAVKETLEKSIVLFALRCKNPNVQEVLRSFAQSDDWFGLYRIMEAIRFDLNLRDRKKDGRQKMVQRGWATDAELDLFDRTVDSYRHRRSRQIEPRPMYLDEAQHLVGSVVLAWLHEVAQRPELP